MKNIVKTCQTFIVAVILLGIVTGCNSDNNTSNPNNNPPGSPVDPRPKYMTPFLSLSLGYTTMHPNTQYRPLGNNPIPSLRTSNDLFHAYTSVGFTGMTTANKNLSSLDDDILDDADHPEYFQNFYKNYKSANNISDDDYSSICFFGITRVHHPSYSGEMGETFQFKTFKYGVDEYGTALYAPTISFVFVGAIDSILTRCYCGYTDDLRSKMIIVAGTHEIAHGRGLNDLGNECPEHTCHQDQDHTKCLYCIINAPQSPADLQYLYPCFFCQKHLGYLQDSLKTKIISGLYMKLPNCN